MIKETKKHCINCSIALKSLHGFLFPFNAFYGGNMTRNIKTAGSKKEKKQQKEESNLIATWSPSIEQISITMKYAQTGALEPLMRTVNFTPDSMAFFKISCLCSDCPESTFDFTDILGSMIKSHKTASKGKISCENCASPECSNVLYTITIKYKR